jgi:hypothetical protein
MKIRICGEETDVEKSHMLIKQVNMTAVIFTFSTIDEKTRTDFYLNDKIPLVFFMIDCVNIVFVN